MNKNEFRNVAKEQRANIADKPIKSQQIAERLKSHPALQGAKLVASYCSIGTEVEMDGVNRWLCGEGALCLPCVVGEGLVFRRVRNLEGELVMGKFRIPEPSVDCPIVDVGALDAVLVPGLSFTAEGLRMGYGGGYYDRFLPRTAAVKFGICFAEQCVKTLPTDQFDVKMDEIITD